jgi:hypothetical protein
VASTLVDLVRYVVWSDYGANLTIALVCVYTCMVVLWSSSDMDGSFLQSECDQIVGGRIGVEERHV